MSSCAYGLLYLTQTHSKIPLVELISKRKDGVQKWWCNKNLGQIFSRTPNRWTMGFLRRNAGQAVKCHGITTQQTMWLGSMVHRVHVFDQVRIVANQVTGCWHIIRLHVLTRKLNEQLWSTTLLLRLHRSHWRNVRMKDRKFRFLGVLGVSGVSATLGEKNVFSWLGLFSNVYTD